MQKWLLGLVLLVKTNFLWVIWPKFGVQKMLVCYLRPFESASAVNILKLPNFKILAFF